MGTPTFAVPALSGLVKHGYPVMGVVTQPDRPQGRGQSMAPSPVKRLAEEMGLKVLQPENVRHPSFLDELRRLAPEIVVVAAFGQILPRQILHGPKGGCINIHPSLLPKYRGAAPINWALIQGEQKTGVTIMQMDEGVDSGPILLQEETPIGPTETFGTLHDRLATMGAELLIIALAMLQAGTLPPQSQNDRLATSAPRLRREDGLIHWRDDCRKIVSLIRGLCPIPGAYTHFCGRQLKIFLAEVEIGPVTEPPGTLAGEIASGLRVAAANGYVLLQEIQLEGRKRMAFNEFLRGVRVVPGQILD